MAVPGPKFHKVKSFQHFFRKILVFSPHGHFPETIHPSKTSPRRGAAGTPEQNPICDSNQMNGPPRAGADRFSDRHTPYEIFFNLKRLAICAKFSRKADRLIIILSHYIISYFFIKINRSVPGGPIGKFSLYFYYTKKFFFCQGPHPHLTFIKKFSIIYIQ